MRARVVWVLLVVALVVPSSVSASQVAFDRWAIGLEVARQHWGGWPPCGVPTFEHHAVAASETIGAWAQVGGPSCVIHLSELAEQLDPGRACVVVTHEVGHLFGYGHTTNPADVMFDGGPMWGQVWECRRAMHRVRYAWACRHVATMRSGCAPIYRWVLTQPDVAGVLSMG